jgi:hypothetical protein
LLECVAGCIVAWLGALLLGWVHCCLAECIAVLQPTLDQLEFIIADTPCYTDVQGCATFDDDQRAAQLCASDQAAASCSACLGTHSACR